MTQPPDCDAARCVELVAVLGAAPLGALVGRYRADLSRVVLTARQGGDPAALAAALHRLQGSGSTLGFDSTAAALAEAGAILAATNADGTGESAWPAVIAAMTAAQDCCARGWAALVTTIPAVAAGDHGGPGANHGDGASKR